MALPKISERFSGAIQKTAQERQIAELQAEITQLRATKSPELEEQVEILREQLQQSGENQIKLELIDPNPQQPRQTITQTTIHTKARSLDRHGQITPVILIPQDSGRYILLDGQLRCEAAKLLGWETIRAVIVPMPKDLNHDSLITFLHFEDLNPLDKAEAIIKEIVKTTALEVEEIPTVLGTVLKRIERDGKTKELADLVTATTEKQQRSLDSLGVQDKERKLVLVLLELGLNPGSVKANLLPMLSLPTDLKTAIRQKGLKGAHALALAALSAKSLSISEQRATKERIAITQQVLELDLTVPQTRKLVAEIKMKFSKSVAQSPTTSLTARMQVATQQLKRNKVWEDPQKCERLELLLSELEKLIGS